MSDTGTQIGLAMLELDAGREFAVIEGGVTLASPREIPTNIVARAHTVAVALAAESQGHNEARERINKLHTALAFAASCIKSGESWSPVCEDMIGGALRGAK